MLRIEFGYVTIDFLPLILFFVCIFLLYVILAQKLSRYVRKITKEFNEGDFQKALVDSKKLIKIYQKFAQVKKHPKTISGIEYLNYVMAVSYFSMNDYENFLLHINSLIQNDDTKEFWLSLYAFCQTDFDSGESHYDRISKNADTSINRMYLDAMRYYRKGEYILSKETINSIYTSLKNPVLLQIANDILGNRDKAVGN